jgi:NAD(P)-dependent dehydrogenase (short-subunit alcohol dehydrogenase family)
MPRLDGQVVLVTGGSRGIGLETTRGLSLRGAEVISASRDETRGMRVAEAIRAELTVPVHFAPLDLGDLLSIPRTLDCVRSLLAGRRLSVVVANAGIWPTRHALSAQGHELAFATNVLGHHALLRGALELDLLADRARVVVVTGDIYIMSSHCSSDYSYRGWLGGQRAYCRSKLGNLWYVRELARRHPEMRIHAVHPGVVGSELGGGNAGIVGAIKRALMLSPEQGAQTSLFCATQPDLESGTYYHNVLVRVLLHPDDPAADDVKSAALWDLVEELCSKEPTPQSGDGSF